MSNAETRHFQKASDFVAQLRASHPDWVKPKDFRSTWVFRGQGSADWEIIPAAWRSHVVNHPAYVYALTKRRHEEAVDDELRPHGGPWPPLETNVLRERVRRVVVQRMFETLGINGFGMLIDRLGLPLPDRKRMVPHWWDYVSFVNGLWVTTQDKLSVPAIVGLAQHHGVPTRLLDWTRRPLTAAFFAADDESAAAVAADQIAVWCLNTAMLEDDERDEAQASATTVEVTPGWKALWFSNSENQFYHAQAGVLTTFDVAGHHFLLHGRWPNMADDVPPGTLIKLTLPRSEVPELLRLLWVEGISKAHLMPTRDNVAATLARVMALSSQLEAASATVGAVERTDASQGPIERASPTEAMLVRDETLD